MSASTGLGALVILFPVVNGIVCEIGLPWLKSPVLSPQMILGQ